MKRRFGADLQVAQKISFEILVYIINVVTVVKMKAKIVF